MIEVGIHSINLDPTSNNPVIILRHAEESRFLPIWIGHPEAMAILLALQDQTAPRPLTHDLLRNVIAQMGYVLMRVEVTRLEEGTFYAQLVLSSEERELLIDARPSDSIALATRVGCPILVAEDVLEEASVEIEEVEEADEESEVERFRQFLENVNPSDFQES